MNAYGKEATWDDHPLHLLSFHCLHLKISLAIKDPLKIV